LFAFEDERGDDVIEAMDFWKNARQSQLPPGAGGWNDRTSSISSAADQHSRLAS
jgi:hypothetical protein